jgi:hypothetical protein
MKKYGDILRRKSFFFLRLKNNMLGDAPFWDEKNLAKKNAQKGTYESKNK